MPFPKMQFQNKTPLQYSFLFLRRPTTTTTTATATAFLPAGRRLSLPAPPAHAASPPIHRHRYLFVIKSFCLEFSQL